ncbi:hypothetical protein [Mycobacteroides abscessus]|uniref:hypothetical protein n=1 Tax=Mycobacteroides abscessus TaxID=36809 RepID=UPI0010567914|nr:hypothetical protein [Mycobacteroides abscessus]
MANREEAMSIQFEYHHVSPIDAAEDRIDTVVTVTLGQVRGRIVRSQYDVGVVTHDAHIELCDDNSPSQLDDPQDLRNLGTVALALADELAAANR